MAVQITEYWESTQVFGGTLTLSVPQMPTAGEPTDVSGEVLDADGNRITEQVPWNVELRQDGTVVDTASGDTVDGTFSGTVTFPSPETYTLQAVNSERGIQKTELWEQTGIESKTTQKSEGWEL